MNNFYKILIKKKIKRSFYLIYFKLKKQLFKF